MTDYVICSGGDDDFLIPEKISKNCLAIINITEGKNKFIKLAKQYLAQHEKLKFYIATRANFYYVFDALIKAPVPYENLIKPEPVIRNVTIAGDEYPMREEFLTNPSKPIDREIAKKNLLLFKFALDSSQFRFFLAFGTLLGAVREGNFIAHDSDVDVGMYETDKNKFLPYLFTLKEQGLELVRFDLNLISLMKDGEYIDIYFFKKKLLPKIGWHCDGFYYPTKHLKTLETIEFHQSQFLAPNNYLGLLAFLYGADWKVPRKDKHAQHLFSIKIFFLKLIPLSLKTFIKKLIK